MRLTHPTLAAVPWSLAAFSLAAADSPSTLAWCITLRYLAVVAATRVPLSGRSKLHAATATAALGIALCPLATHPEAALLIAAAAGVSGGLFAAASNTESRTSATLRTAPMQTAIWRALGAGLGAAAWVAPPVLIVIGVLLAGTFALVDEPSTQPKTRPRGVSSVMSITHALVNAAPVVVAHITDSTLLAAFSLCALQLGAAVGLVITARTGHRAHVVGTASFVTGVTHRAAPLCMLTTAFSYALFATAPSATVLLTVVALLGGAGELAKHAATASPDSPNGVPGPLVVQIGLLLAGPCGLLAVRSPYATHALAAATAVTTLVILLRQARTASPAV